MKKFTFCQMDIGELLSECRIQGYYDLEEVHIFI